MVEMSLAFANASEALRVKATGSSDVMLALAKDGDAFAQMAMGELYLIGRMVKRDFGKALKWIGRAAEQGQIDAQRAQIYLTNAGIGRSANPSLARNMLARLGVTDRFSAIQARLLEHADSRQRLVGIEPEVISADPRIVIWRGLFGEAEVGYLRHIGAPLLEPAMVVNPATGRGRLDPIRKSDTTSFSLITEDLMLQEITGTIAAATGTVRTQGEPLTILRYPVGGEYRPHYDAYGGHWTGPQRLYTALIWLNDDYEGGATHFPRLDIAVRGNPGDLLVFGNLLPDGQRDDRLEHAGLPVTSGEKWLASRWITTRDTLELPTFG